MPANAAPTRRRLTREQRARQLLDVAWALVGEEGTDALTLGRLAEAAGVTKPVAYDHFVTRNGLLAALYDPLWTSAIQRPADIFLALLALAALTLLRLPPWLVVLASGALGGVSSALF